MKPQMSDSPMCSLFARTAGERVIGSAREVPRFLLIELEKPWARKALQTPHFSDEIRDLYQEAVAEERFDGKFLPFAPDETYSGEGVTRVFDYVRPEDPLVNYQKHSYQIPDDALTRACEILLLEPERRSELEEMREGGRESVRELMVCTHTERDPCCGTFGKPIYGALRTHYADGNLRAWQISHVGGHRHCPNLLDFPGGRYWGRLELSDLKAFVDRTGDVAKLTPLYRGWSALPPLAQFAEQAIFERKGWNWLAYRKNVRVLETDEEETRATILIEYEGEEGESGRYQVNVEQGEDVQRLAGSCGEPSDELKTAPVPQYHVTEIREI